MGQISQAGFNFLLAEEGFKTVAYQLSYKKKGKPYTEPYCTVGVGHYDSGGKLGITKGKDYGAEYCVNLFKDDAAKLGKNVNAVWQGSGMNQCQYDAMLSYAWNCGGGGFNSSLKPYIQKWVNKQISDQELSSIWQVSRCSTSAHYKRRKKEVNFFFSDPASVQGSDNYNLSYKGIGTSKHLGQQIGNSGIADTGGSSAPSAWTDGGMNAYSQLTTVTPPQKAKGEHTRIYKYIGSEIKLDEFSIPINAGESPVNTSTGMHEGDTANQSDDTVNANLNPAGNSTVPTMAPGVQYPAIQINDWVCAERNIVGLELKNDEFVPTMKLEIVTTGTDLMKKDLCKEGDHVNIFIAPGHGMLKSIRMDFIITYMVSPTFTQYNLTGTYPYTIFGELNIPGLYDNGTSFSFTGTSRDALIDACKKLKLGFFFCDAENTTDSQMWYCMAENEDENNPTIVQYMQSLIQHAWKNEYSFFNGWIDFRYALTFVNVNKLLGESGQEEGFDATIFNTIFSNSRTSDGRHGNMTDEEKKENPQPQVKVITNIPQDDDSATAFYALDFEVVDISQEITKKIGTQMSTTLGVENAGLEGGQTDLGMAYSIIYNPDKFNPKEPLKGGFYIMMGPGQPTNHKSGENQSYVSTNTKIVNCGTQQQTMSDDDSSTMMDSGNNMLACGNTNKYYDAALQHNYINNMQLWKKYMKVTLSGANFALMRGEKIPVIMLDNNKLQSQIGSLATDSSDSLAESEQEKIKKLNATIFTDESGWFIIQQVVYEYDPDTHDGTSRWKTHLVLSRREWPIPNYYNPDAGETSSSTASAEETVEVENTIDLDGESQTEHEQDDDTGNNSTTGASSSSTDGLKDYMVELLESIKSAASQHSQQVKLVGGRRWAIDADGNKVEGASAFLKDTNGTSFIVVDADNNLKSVASSQKSSVHLTGEAMDLLNGDGTTLDNLLKDSIMLNYGALRIMYEHGLSCIKEQSICDGAKSSHLHIGINTGKEKAWWDGVQALNAGSPDIKSDTVNFNISGYASNVKKQFELEQKPEVTATAEQMANIKKKWKASKASAKS